MSQLIRTYGLVVALVGASLPVPVLAGPLGRGSDARPAAQESVATYAEAACPFEIPEGQVEGEDLNCGYLTVPEFHDAPDGPTLDLLVAIYRSTAAEPAAEPLIMLLGGPGQELTAVLGAFTEGSPISYRPYLERQDVIILEQRGIGYSRPSLACYFDMVAGQQPEVTASELEDWAGAFAICADELRQNDELDLEAYDTLQSAADVNDLRAALGYDQVDLLGISYGSKLALTVMRDYPEGVRSAILASPLPLEANIPAGQIIGFDRALKALFAACTADPQCGAAHPNLEAALAEAVALLDETPLELTVDHPISGTELDLVIDGEGFIQIVYFTVYIGLTLPVVPSLIDDTAVGNTARLELIAPLTAAFSAGLSYGANVVYNCNDELSFTDSGQIAELIAEADVMPVLTDGEAFDTFENFAICEELDLLPAAESENSPVEGDVPALILTGEYDPITPPAYGELIAESLPNSFMVTLPGLAHDPITTGGECALAIATAFLANPETEPDTTCVDELGLVFVA